MTFRIERAARSEERRTEVAVGTPVRRALRAVGLFGEGCAVLDRGRSIPLDEVIVEDCELTIVPTFSGG